MDPARVGELMAAQIEQMLRRQGQGAAAAAPLSQQATASTAASHTAIPTSTQSQRVSSIADNQPQQSMATTQAAGMNSSTIASPASVASAAALQPSTTTNNAFMSTLLSGSSDARSQPSPTSSAQTVSNAPSTDAGLMSSQQPASLSLVSSSPVDSASSSSTLVGASPSVDLTALSDPAPSGLVADTRIRVRIRRGEEKTEVDGQTRPEGATLLSVTSKLVEDGNAGTIEEAGEYDDEEGDDDDEADDGAEGEDGPSHSAADVAMMDADDYDDGSGRGETTVTSCAGKGSGQSSNPNARPRIRSFAMTHMNRSGVVNFNGYLKRINYRVHDLHELTPQELFKLAPDWLLNVRRENGQPYLADTLRGYVSALGRVIRLFEPKDEWNAMSLHQRPEIKAAMQELKRKEWEERERVRLAEAASNGDMVKSEPMMTTRRAGQRPALDTHNQGQADTISVPSSPRLTGDGVAYDSQTSGRRVPSSIPRLTPAQERHIMSQLDPQHPEGLFRLNFIQFTRHFGITFAEEARALSVRHFLMGKIKIKIRYTRSGNAEVEDGSNEATEGENVATGAGSEVAASSAGAASSAMPMETDDSKPTESAMDAPVHSESQRGEGQAMKQEDRPTADVPSSSASATATNPASSSTSASTSTSDEELPVDRDRPFEVVDPSDPSPHCIHRVVRFLLFVPPPNSRRQMNIMYERPWEGDNCPLKLWDTYIKHRPPLILNPPPEVSAIEVENSFSLWLKPKKTINPFDVEWFVAHPVGRNKASTLVSSLTVGLGMGTGYTNQSIQFAPRRLIPFSEEEIQILHAENARRLWGVPTKEQHAAAQQSAIDAASAVAQKKAAAAAAKQDALIKAQLSKQREAMAAAQAAAREQQQRAAQAAQAQAEATQRQRQTEQFFGTSLIQDPAALAHQQLLHQQQQHLLQQQAAAAAASHSSSSSSPAPSASPFPLHLHPFRHKRTFFMMDSYGSDLQRRSEAFMRGIDESYERVRKERRQEETEQKQAASPTQPPSDLHSFRFLSSSPHTLHPPLPSMPSLPLRLGVSDIDSALALSGFLSQLHSDLTTLASHAAQCQSSLDLMRSVTEHLQQECNNTLQIQQQRRKIAEQFKLIQEQQSIIRQLKEQNTKQQTNTNSHPSSSQPMPSSSTTPAARPSPTPHTERTSTASPASDESKEQKDGDGDGDVDVPMNTADNHDIASNNHQHPSSSSQSPRTDIRGYPQKVMMHESNGNANGNADAQTVPVVQ